jgi:hypothetical protein
MTADFPGHPFGLFVLVHFHFNLDVNIHALHGADSMILVTDV